MSWHLKSVSEDRFIQKFQSYLSTFQLTTKQTTNNSLNINNLRTVLEEKLNTVKTRAGFLPGDRLRLIASNSKFNHPISTETGTNINFNKLLDQIENILTSDQNVNINGTIFDIQLFKIPRCFGRTRKILNLTKDRHAKKVLL